ncbi:MULTISPECIES: type I polyketide synthase [Streptomyces]|uniref:type I polyketide synthase n=1 Tax=Streptomyces TaxID=1883 RepID=UPI00068C24F9|nr:MULTISPECIES: type I polyketide synthase [Streptomyces]
MNDETAQALRSAAAEIRALRARVKALEAGAGGPEPLAVVGMACRFPGGCDTPEKYWEFLAAGGDAIRPLPVDRWKGELPAGGAAWAGTVDGVAEFDAAFFGIPEPEARLMDPQQRLVLECAWEALERAGLERPGRTGVFLGVAHQDYLFTALAAGIPLSAYLGLGNARSIIANRVSHTLGLTGPSIAVDTACSSSLAALHLAAQSLRTGECDVALAGGVSLILAGISTEVTGATLPLAPDGVLKALGAGADGMVRGEGAGLVVLKRLRDAQADGDEVLAVVHATACNSDGASNGLTAPNPVAQRRLLTDALTRSGLTPADVALVEMHATGTALGDPIEFAAIAEAYGDAPDPCLLSSAKAAIGHLEAAAGIASFIKAVECVRRGEVPPQPQLRELNPHLALDGTRFAVTDRRIPWPAGRRRVAGVSSFGFGGTNVHVLVEAAAPVSRAPRPETGLPLILPLSARSPQALADLAARYADLLAQVRPEDVPELVAAAARCRPAHRHRHCVTGPTADALRRALAAAPPGHEPQPVVFRYGATLPPRLPDPAAGLGPVAAEAARAEAACWAAHPAEEGPATELLVWQAAATAAWRALGVRPDACTGSGSGARTAAWAGGRLSRAEAVAEQDGPSVVPAAPPGLVVDLGPGPAGANGLDATEPAARAAVLARLWCAGAEVDWRAVYPGAKPTAAVPGHPWHRRTHWIEQPPRHTGERARAAAAAAEPARALGLLAERVAELLGVTAQDLDLDVPARELDLDSVAFVDLKARIEEECGVVIPITDLIDGASLREIAGRLRAGAA